MEWETTASILRRLSDSRDDSAWNLLCARFHAPIARFARRMGVPSAACEDVAQETLMAALQAYRRGTYDAGRGRLHRWMFGIAYRCALNSLRREGARREETPPASSFLGGIPDEASASQAFDLEWERELLAQCERSARADFEPATFRAYELVVRSDRAPADVARELGLPPQSVYNAKHRVLKRIRELRARMEELDG